MTESTMTVATPAVVPAAAVTATATSTPIDGAFTALLAAALGGVPPTTVTTALPAGEPATTEDETAAAATDATDATDATGAVSDPVALLAAVLAVPSSDVPAADAPAVTGAPTAPTASTATVPPRAAVAPAVDGTPATEGSEASGLHRPEVATPADGPAVAAAVPGAAPAGGRAAGITAATGTSASVDPAAGSARSGTTGRTEVPLSAGPGPGTEGSPPAPPKPTTLTTEVTAPAAPASSAPASSAPGSSAPAAPAPTSDLPARMLGRVMDALDILENAPPPRRLTIDLPDADGLRLHVALRGSEVQVSVVGGGSGGDLSGWSRDLSEALAARGFSLGGFGAGAGRDGRHGPADARPPSDDDTVPRPRARPRVGDQGLRL